MALAAALAAAVAVAGSLMMLGRGGTAEAAGAAAQPEASRPAPRAAESGLPRAVTAALARSDVVVVALVARGSVVDELSLAEARAGARTADAGFVAVNVLRERDGKAFARLLGSAETPATLVYRAPGRLVVRLDGFADLDTVAQAALDARRRGS